MEHEPFRIHPALESYVRRQSEEENRLLEESLLAEGCRDPLVVWKEENVLIDGHHRKRICDRHNIGYSVVYRSFADMEEAKAWMDLNSLGRRNLDRADRDEMIRRLASSGKHTQKEIAQAVGLTRQAVTHIVGNKANNLPETNINAVSPAAEIEAKQAELDSLRKRLKDEQDERDREKRELVKALNEAQAKAKRSTAPEIVEKVVEKPVVREVIREVVPESVQARLKDLEAQVRKTNANEQYLRNMEEKKFKLQSEIAALKEQATKDRVTANIEDAISFCQKERFVSTQVIEMAERGELTLEQIDMLLSVVGEISMESTKILNILQGLKSNFKKGGALRAL